MEAGTVPGAGASGREVALLTNPSSGRGRGREAGKVALRRLRDAGFGVRDLCATDAAHGLELAREAVADGVWALVVVGGDGMVHLGTQAVAESEVHLGIVPTGTGNDVARYVGVPRRDPTAAVDRVIASSPRRLDLARSGATYFVTVLAAGFDAVVNERANAMTRPRGAMRYHLATLAELRTFEPISYTLQLDGETRRVEAMLVAVGNGPSFGGGLRITEGALLDDGMLDVVVIHPMSRLGLVRAYPRLFRGTHVHLPEYEHHRVREVTIAASGIVAYADGERLGALPLTVRSVPGGLSVLA